MGNSEQHEEAIPISGDLIKLCLEDNRLLKHLEIKALHNRYQWSLEKHDHKKSFMVVHFDLSIRQFKTVGSFSINPIYAFTVENAAHSPFILFPSSNNYYNQAVKNVRRYIRAKTASPSERQRLLVESMTMSVISDLDARINWVFEVILP